MKLRLGARRSKVGRFFLMWNGGAERRFMVVEHLNTARSSVLWARSDD